ncbi:helix-turn-helix transcriptional regulator [Myxococcus sp. K38C18041901]|uniref:helix-turn-helix domain-containing protein n=1 Tax=Myxococcus guangdongensis TaxID=2906760 RepID=UPI0020A81925|nr:helix-turn-helix transcriptional regulator [Myxococcus guangdongensis]MCP3064189.1 helix-turn-helix transcriptional regulator [Myxococcus guangdongensis]
MPIRIMLDEVLARRGMKAKQLAEQIGVSQTHLSLFRSGKVRGVRFSTLSKLCLALGCEPGELLRYDPDPADMTTGEED